MKKKSIWSGSFYFSYGDNCKYVITHDTEESAPEEYEKIIEIAKS